MSIGISVEQVDNRGVTIAARTAAHLIELDLVERQPVQNNATNMRNVHAFAKRRRCHQHAERIGAEQLFCTIALNARKTSVIEANAVGQLRHARAQRTRHSNRLLARGNVDDGLFATRNNVRQIVIAVLQVAVVIHMQIFTTCLVIHVITQRQHLRNIARHGIRSRCRERQNRGITQLLEHRAQRAIRHAVAGLRLAHMVRFVDCHETDALAGGKFFRVVHQKLRCGQNDIHIARGQTSKRNGTLLRRALARKRDR